MERKLGRRLTRAAWCNRNAGAVASVAAYAEQHATRRVSNQASGEDVTTKDTIQRYFDSLQKKSGWEAFLADDMTFTSYGSPIKQVTGKGAYLEATKRFFSMINAVELRDVIGEGDKACALTRYDLRGPGDRAFDSHVAEVFTVRNGKISSLEIYFDRTPYPKPPPAA